LTEAHAALAVSSRHERAGRFVLARGAAADAAAMLDRFPGRGDVELAIVRVQAHVAVGNLDRVLGDLDAARDRLVKAVTLAERVLGRTHRETGAAYTALGTAARLAAERTEPDDLTQLRRTTEELAQATDTAARSRFYGRFHVELAAAAQSARLTREQVALQTEIGALLCLVLGDDEYREEVADRHRSVISAVQDGAHETARELAERCVQDSTARLVALRLTL
jgi:DNA-binding FadR family transcriptional regulator